MTKHAFNIKPETLERKALERKQEQFNNAHRLISKLLERYHDMKVNDPESARILYLDPAHEIAGNYGIEVKEY